MQLKTNRATLATIWNKLKVKLLKSQYGVISFGLIQALKEKTRERGHMKFSCLLEKFKC